MKVASIALTVLLSAAVAVAVTQINTLGLNAPVSTKETAFERVMRTNTLRCGYYAFAPIATKDPTTGKVSGLGIDIMESIAAKTGIKIEWTEEVTFGNWIPALQAGRFDAVCTPLWADASYARIAQFTRPLFLGTVVPLVRADETRFTDKAESLNQSDVTLTYQENNMTATLAQTLFPHAKTLAVDGGADYGVLMQNVVAKKADFALWDRVGFSLYNKANPGLLKILERDAPLKIIPCEIPVRKGEQDLSVFLDAGVEDLLLSGEMDRLLRKWEPEPGQSFLRAAKPYVQAQPAMPIALNGTNGGTVPILIPASTNDAPQRLTISIPEPETTAAPAAPTTPDQPQQKP